jgi:hypothetical protein
MWARYRRRPFLLFFSRLAVLFFFFSFFLFFFWILVRGNKRTRKQKNKEQKEQENKKEKEKRPKNKKTKKTKKTKKNKRLLLKKKRFTFCMLSCQKQSQGIAIGAAACPSPKATKRHCRERPRLLSDRTFALARRRCRWRRT